MRKGFVARNRRTHSALPFLVQNWYPPFRCLYRATGEATVLLLASMFQRLNRLCEEVFRWRLTSANTSLQTLDRNRTIA